MELADFDAIFLERAEGGLRFLKFDGEMAGIVVDAEVFVETRIVGVFSAESLEETDGFGGGFKPAERLGFEAEMEFASGAGAEGGDVLDAAPDIVPDGFFLFGTGDEFLE